MSDSKTVPIDRVRIFRRDGSCIAEFQALVSRSYVIGAEGRAQFTYPTRKTDVVNGDVLNPGNWLLIQSTQLPPWVGVIDTPREWSSRSVTVSAYTPERVLSWRIGPLEKVVTGSPGSIFEQLIYLTNQAEQTVIRAAAIFRGGTQKQVTLNPSPLNGYLKKLWEESGEDYTWTPIVNAEGRLIVQGHWVQTLGAITSALLHEGTGGGNIEAAGRIMVEDGPIINSVLAYGEGQTWQSKPHNTVTQSNSIGQYGLREASQEYNGVTSLTTLTENARQKLREFATPARSFSLNALNVGDTFKFIRLGNVLNIQFQNIGFRGGRVGWSSRVRIVGMSYNPSTKNKIQLVAREVTA